MNITLYPIKKSSTMGQNKTDDTLNEVLKYLHESLLLETEHAKLFWNMYTGNKGQNN